MVALPKSRMTVKQFLNWWETVGGDERFELIDGQVFAMGRDRVSHNRAKLRAANALSSAINAAGLDCEAFIDGMGVTGDDFNFRIPDAVVQCGRVDPQATTLDKPVIIVEVVSPTSEERDVHAKLHDYFSVLTLHHYLIVYVERGYLVHHSRIGHGDAIQTKFVNTGPLSLHPPGLTIDVSALLGETSMRQNLEN